MSISKITAEIKKINDVLEQKLSIPDYQRPYRWQEENVRLLLQDIFESWKDGKKSYRVGSVILHRENEEVLNIVDGHQRITTILLILSVLRSSIGNLLRSSLKYEPIYSKYNIVQNKVFIEKWVDENISNETEDFCKYLAEYCEFVEIKVTDLSEAFQMFDSQNGRGKELETYNLLKAYHIRAMDIESQETKIECDCRWESATRHKLKLNSDIVFDVLKQIFNEQLYRTRRWSKKEYAFEFNKKKICEFKGFSIDKHNIIKYPFQNKQLLQYIANKYFESIGLGVKGMTSRFKTGDFENISPFVLINQNIINGKPFFDYIETYVEIYKQLFVDLEADTHLFEFKKFYKTYCYYSGSHRDGDKYLKELYKSLIFLLFDKYGEAGVIKYHKTLYALVYRFRLQKIQVKYNAVAKYPLEFFSTIENSNCYLDLQELERRAKEEIYCKKEVGEIIQFFVDDFKVRIIKTQ